jgi:hypothetical protein
MSLADNVSGRKHDLHAVKMAMGTLQALIQYPVKQRSEYEQK